MNDGQAAPVRRFNVIDGMIAVAALAATFWLARTALPALAAFLEAYRSLANDPVTNSRVELERLRQVRMLESRVGFMIEAILLIWFLAFAVMRLRRPRPPFPVVAVQPGMVAFWAAATSFALGLAPDPTGGAAGKGGFALAVMCLAVPSSWGVLKAAGKWRPEAGWIDRFGRTLGLFWWAMTWACAAFLIVLWADWGGLYPEIDQVPLD